MKLSEKSLLKTISIVFVIMMIFWGILSLSVPLTEVPYGFWGRIMGVGQIILGLIVLVGIWRLK